MIMNGAILKNLLLIFAILINGYAYYVNFPTELLIKLHLIFAIAFLAAIFFRKDSIVNLLLLALFIMLFKRSSGLGIGLPLPSQISPERIVLIIISLIFMFNFLIAKKSRMLAFSSVETAMILFSMYIIFSMVISGTIAAKGKGVALGFFLSAYGIPFFIFFISKNTINDEKKIKKFFIFLSVIGLYLGLTGIFEYFQFSQLVYPRYIMAAQFAGRAKGPFVQPAVNGTVIGMIIFTTLLLLLTESKKWRKWFYIITLACLTAALVFTLTRSGWLAFLIATLIIPIFMPKLRKAFFVSLLAISFVSVFLINFSGIKVKTFKNEEELRMGKNRATLIDKIFNRTKDESSITARTELYKIAFKMFLDHPFLGSGYNAFHKARSAYGLDLLLLTNNRTAQVSGIHNTLLALLVDIGVVGISIYLFIIFNIFNVCRKLYNKLPRDRFLGKDLVVMCTGAIIVYFVSSQMYDIRFFYFPNSLFFCMAGIMFGVCQRILQSGNKTEMRHSFPEQSRNKAMN